MMKIVAVDNFNREHISDLLIAENLNNFYGRHIVDFLQEKFGGEHSDRYYTLQKDDYEIYDAYKGLCDE